MPAFKFLTNTAHVHSWNYFVFSMPHVLRTTTHICVHITSFRYLNINEIVCANRSMYSDTRHCIINIEHWKNKNCKCRRDTVKALTWSHFYLRGLDYVILVWNSLFSVQISGKRSPRRLTSSALSCVAGGVQNKKGESNQKQQKQDLGAAPWSSLDVLCVWCSLAWGRCGSEEGWWKSLELCTSLERGKWMWNGSGDQRGEKEEEKERASL